MKKITTTIFALFVLSSACLLNAQMEVFSDGSVSVGNKTAPITKVGINGNMVQIGNTAAPNFQITADKYGAFNIGDITAPQLTLEPYGYINIGNKTSKITINFEGTVYIGNTSQLKINPDGNINLGNAKSPQLQIKNNGKTVNIFNSLFEANVDGSLNMSTSLMDFLLDNTSINLNSIYSQIKIDHQGLISLGSKTIPQLTINRNGNVQLGNSSSIVNIGSETNPQIKVNSNNGCVHIGNTSEPLFDAQTRFELNVPKATIRYTTNPSLGFQFIPVDESVSSVESIDGVKASLKPVRKKVMALTGLGDGEAIIGTIKSNMLVIYSKFYFSSGKYIGLLTSSDSNLKTNIRDLMPVSERIAQLRPVIYDFIVDDNTDVETIPDDVPAKSNSKGNGNGNNGNGNGNNGNNGNGNNGNGNGNGNNNNNNNGNNDENQKDRVGFLAQEVLPLFPDLVVMDADSSLRLDYAGLIPYLTKAIQEQTEIVQEQASAIQTQNNTIQEQRAIIESQNTALEHQNKKIERLEQRISEVQMGVSSASFIILDDESRQDSQDAQTTEKSESQIYKSPQINKTGNILYQNTPNPFNLSTTIKYQLSNNTTNAKICIYNLTGKQLQCYNLQTTKGENSIEVRASSLQSGIYLYSLIVDDKLISTKRMILTE